ncbi:MAG TPA: ComF family protein [Caulobacteraceae bacterium]|jgi:ComF family protein|nr:ComF family protein [Caulobacteraceae bacterium]
MAPWLRGAAGGLIDLLLPPRALDEAASGRPMQSLGLSAAAWSRIRFIEAPFCEACGSPLDFDLGLSADCAACQGRRTALDHVRAACLYDEYSRDVVLKLKHADRTDLAALFARWLARAAADILPDVDAVAPVPLHRWRLLGRRFNQAAEVARPLAAAATLAYWPDALVRPRPTASQAGKSGSGRRRNVAGAFEVAPRWRARVAGARILLVDDVLTTGATVEGCARALKGAGAARVDVAVIAKVKERPARAI